MTAPSQVESPVLFRARWSLWHSGGAAAIFVTAMAILQWQLVTAVMAAFFWWLAMYESVLVAEVTRDELVIKTPLRTHYVAISDIRHVGRWYGTVWKNGRPLPWQFPWGRQRARLFEVLDDLRGSWTGTP